MESGLADAISIIEMKSYLAGITSTSAEVRPGGMPEAWDRGRSMTGLGSRQGFAP